jgi:hypothetical protein
MGRRRTAVGSRPSRSRAGGSELRYEGWATTSGELAGRERAWARQAQREAEAELAAIRAAVEAGMLPNPLSLRHDHPS